MPSTSDDAGLSAPGVIRIASIGDSFSEGVGDPRPGGPMRGWTDRLSEILAASTSAGVWRTNFAVRGRLLASIAGEQLDAALALDPLPTVLTFNGGGNDMLRRHFDEERIRALILRVVERTAASGVSLLMLTGPDPSARLPRGELFAERGEPLTQFVESLVATHPHAVFADNFRDREMRRAPYWAPDRLHLSPLGHARVAARAAVTLGTATELPLGEPGPEPRRTVLTESAYAARYVVPWLARRALGTSSGDRRQPKYSSWQRVTPQ